MMTLCVLLKNQRRGLSLKISLRQKNNKVIFDFPAEEKKIHFEVDIKSVKGNVKVAERLAAMCFRKMAAENGATKAEAEKMRNDWASKYVGGEDAPAGSPAWSECIVQIAHTSPLVSCSFLLKSGKTLPFQTTQAAAGGSILDADRILRLCWVKLNAGASKEAVIAYRNKLYQQLSGRDASSFRKQETRPRAKRQRTA